MVDSVAKKHSKNSPLLEKRIEIGRNIRNHVENFTIAEQKIASNPPSSSQNNQQQIVTTGRRQNSNNISGRSRIGWIRGSSRRRSTTLTTTNTSTITSFRNNYFYSLDQADSKDRESRKSFRSVQGKFSEHNSEDGSQIPLITKLDKYTQEELREYRQASKFNLP
jgi:hypothetical protein